MALPTLVKTWQVSKNQAVASTGVEETDYKSLVRLIKNTLKGFTTLPWTCAGSSDAVTAAMDASDRWIDNTKVVPGTGAHSWIVLKQTGVHTNFSVCIDLNSATGTRVMSLIVSPTVGFTGGTTSARPTATDEIVILNGIAWAGNHTGGDDSFKLHAWQSSDGQCTRMAIYCNNICVAFWLFDRPQNPVTGWTNPSVSIALAGLGNFSHPTFSNLIDTANAYGRAPVGTMSMRLSTEGYASLSLGEILAEANEISGGWPFIPASVVSRTTGAKGRHATLFDFWFGSTATLDGDTYPNSVAKTFVQIGNLILPGDGGTFLTV